MANIIVRRYQLHLTCFVNGNVLPRRKSDVWRVRLIPRCVNRPGSGRERKKERWKRKRDSNDLSNAALELRHKFRPPSAASGRAPGVSFGQFPRYDFPSSTAVSSPLNRHRGVASRVDICTPASSRRAGLNCPEIAQLWIFPRLAPEIRRAQKNARKRVKYIRREIYSEK